MESWDAGAPRGSLSVSSPIWMEVVLRIPCPSRRFVVIYLLQAGILHRTFFFLQCSLELATRIASSELDWVATRRKESFARCTRVPMIRDSVLKSHYIGRTAGQSKRGPGFNRPIKEPRILKYAFPMPVVPHRPSRPGLTPMYPCSACLLLPLLHLLRLLLVCRGRDKPRPGWRVSIA